MLTYYIEKTESGKFRGKTTKSVAGKFITTKSCSTVKEAETEFNKLQLEYFKQNSKSLPKGVSLSKKDEIFYLRLTIYNYENQDRKSIELAKSKNLKTILEVRKKVIASLIDFDA